MLDKLKYTVCKANMDLVAQGLVIQTFGNVSGIDRSKGLVVIKPSGMQYNKMTPKDMVAVELSTGKVVDSHLRPSSDTPTHLEIYRAFGQVGGVVHTHSMYATAWAQARREIPVLGTTHADYFHGYIPCARLLTSKEIKGDYEANTGKAIVERFANIDPMEIPAALVADHGPFAWGATPSEAVHNAVLVEYLAQLSHITVNIDPDALPISREMLDRHYLRKHGPDAYYGQAEKDK
ncbi:MAG: L-ribulose-5-phosphate 4-epimerase AraD [Planctomycetes bacterium]|nr:L-ribulose-5-phosphate 4-epimerase AraD [Planctomycetota bacterium]